STFCANRTKPIMFTNLSTSQDSIKTMNWDFGDLNINDTSKVVKHTYTQGDKYLVVLRVSTVNGCDDIATQFIDILKAPKPNFIMTALDSCFSSNKVSFTNTTVID